MRHSLYSLIIFIVFVGLLLYLLTALSPWDEQVINQSIERFGLLTGKEFQEFIGESIRNGSVLSLLNLKNVAILGFVLMVIIVAGFASFHLFVDKLFFKKFYENPSVFNAIRRGIILGLLIEGLIILRLSGSFELYIVAGCIVLAALIEVFFSIIFKKEPKEQKTGKITP